MKKGFTMIELIFVIVILGILASVAIPRLASTREDAEISAAAGNLRTLVSDASAYYVARGNFDNANWADFTNVPLNGAATTAATLRVGVDNDCITVQLVERNGAAPAHILITRKAATDAGRVCAEVLGSEPLRPYVNSTVTYTQPGEGDTVTQETIENAMAIGSSSRIYTPAATTPRTGGDAGAAGTGGVPGG